MGRVTSEWALKNARLRASVLTAENEQLTTSLAAADEQYCNDANEKQRLYDRLAELTREFDIVDSACDFWKQEAIDRGYDEGNE